MSAGGARKRIDKRSTLTGGAVANEKPSAPPEETRSALDRFERAGAALAGLDKPLDAAVAKVLAEDYRGPKARIPLEVVRAYMRNEPDCP
jgi:hypothetical protein